MLVIAAATLLTLCGLFLSVFLPELYENYFHLLWLPDPEMWAWIALLGWTTWLLVFSQVALVNGPCGQQWVSRHQPCDDAKQFHVSLQNMTRSLRVSQIIFYLLFFLIVSSANGYLKAQLDLTLVTVTTPALVVGMYGLVMVAMQLNSTITTFAAPFCFILSVSVCTFMTSHIGGKGSIILVFAHSIGKSLQYFGNELPGQEEEDDYGPYDDEGAAERKKSSSSHDEQAVRSYTNILSPVAESPRAPRTPGGGVQEERGSVHPGLNRQRSGSRSYEDLHRITTTNTISDHDTDRNSRFGPGKSKQVRRSTSYNDLANVAKRATIGRLDVTSGQIHSHAEAIATLASRGQIDSALVSVELPHSLRNHWLLKFSSRTVGFGVHMARSMAITNTALAGVMKAGTALGVVMALILGLISVLSVLQQNMQLFPKLISYHTSQNDILFNHIISNVTLIKSPTLYSPSMIHNKTSALPVDISPKLKKPYYVACDLRWNSLSLLDFAIFSELSYFDVDGAADSTVGASSDEMQRMLDELFPHMGFRHIQGEGDEEVATACSSDDGGVYWGGSRGREVCSGKAGGSSHRRGDSVPEWVRRALGGHDHDYSSFRSRGFTGGHPMYIEAYSMQLGKNFTVSVTSFRFVHL